MTVTQTAPGRWEPSERYPDPAIQVLDPSFNKYRLLLASVERLATGMRWCEGPVYFGDARCLLWSDIPNNRIMRWDEDTGGVSVYRKPSDHANGNTRDRQGRLITCEHDSRRVTRTEYDGSITVLIDRFDGKRLNSPNDVVVKSDDTIWFTDPVFGILANYEGHVDTPELPMNVYRFDPQERARQRGGERRRPAGTERARVLARREEVVHRRVARHPGPYHPRLRRNRRRPARATASCSFRRSLAARPTASGSMSTATCGAAGAWATTSRTA